MQMKLKSIEASSKQEKLTVLNFSASIGLIYKMKKMRKMKKKIGKKKTKQ